MFTKADAMAMEKRNDEKSAAMEKRSDEKSAAMEKRMDAMIFEGRLFSLFTLAFSILVPATALVRAENRALKEEKQKVIDAEKNKRDLRSDLRRFIQYFTGI